jgi:NADH:ubiquinone oxidoreductase subunit 4 (subunit M)
LFYSHKLSIYQILTHFINNPSKISNKIESIEACLLKYILTGTTDYLTLLNYSFDFEVQKVIFLCFFASLAVKIPKFPFHI